MILANTALGGCATYVNSASLQTKTAAAKSAFPNETEALAPFNEQLAHLATFANSEDLAVADYWAAARDAHFARIIALDVKSDRPRALKKQIDDRLAALVGSSPVTPSPFLASDVADLARQQKDIASRSKAYLSIVGNEKLNISCPALAAQYTEDEANALVLAPVKPGDRELGTIAAYCWSIPRVQAKIGWEEINLNAVQGLLGAEMAAQKTAEAQTKIAAPIASPDLANAISAEVNFEATNNVAKLATLQQDINAILDKAQGVSAASRLVGWTKVGDLVDKLLQLKACDIKEADTSALECPASATAAPAAGTTSDDLAKKAKAVWALAEALAKLSDVREPQWKSAQWLIAAKAIVAAEKADYQLQKTQWVSMAAAHQQRVAVLLRELAALRQAKASLSGPRPDCHSGLVGGDIAPNAHCLLGAYITAWDNGIIPAEVLAYRPIQLERSFTVKRASIAAQKQHALAAAAIASMSAYGAGGLKAELIAQALFSAAAIGAAFGA